MELVSGVDTLWCYTHSHGTRHRVKKHPSNCKWYVCHILPWLGGGWKCGKGGEDIVTIFSPRGENIRGWKYRLTPEVGTRIARGYTFGQYTKMFAVPIFCNPCNFCQFLTDKKHKSKRCQQLSSWNLFIKKIQHNDLQEGAQHWISVWFSYDVQNKDKDHVVCKMIHKTALA